MSEEYQKAYQDLYDHVLTCPYCPENCAEGATLRRAVREAR